MMNQMNYGIFAVMGAFFIFFFLIGIAMYVLGALGLYTMAQRRQLENAWVAWVPVAQLYILGKLIQSLRIGSFEVPQIELVLPGFAVAGVFLGMIPVIGQIVALVSMVVSLFALYKLFSMYRPDQATLYLILSIVLPFMGPVFIFLMRNDTPVYSESF